MRTSAGRQGGPGAGGRRGCFPPAAPADDVRPGSRGLVGRAGVRTRRDRVRLLHAERSFFGVLRVTEDPLWNAHMLLHGSTTHGCQSLDPTRATRAVDLLQSCGTVGADLPGLAAPPTTWPKSACSGWGRVRLPPMANPARKSRSTRSIRPSNASPETPITSPTLPIAARRWRSFLGDARLSLVYGPARQFDLLVVDVFSSDTVPIHLITREALRIYFDRTCRARPAGDPHFQSLPEPRTDPGPIGRGRRPGGADVL